MQINSLSKQLALKKLFREIDLAPGGSMSYRQLERLWHNTGLRRNDLDDALNESIYRGDLAERYTDEGRVATLTPRSHLEKRSNPEPLHLKEAYRNALAALEWARVRAHARKVSLFGRRRSDL